MFEPSELERGHFTDLDTEIRTADVPERFMVSRLYSRNREKIKIFKRIEKKKCID